MRKKIAILKGQSVYNVLRHFADTIAYKLDALGYDIDLIDLLSYVDVGFSELVPVIQDADCIFSFNLMGIPGETDYDTLIKNKFFSEMMHKPWITYLVDHPMYHYLRFDTAKYYKCNIMTFDRGNVSYIKNRYNNIENAEFLPFFGLKAENQYNFKDKDINLLFVGSYIKPISMEEYFKDMNPNYINFIIGLCELMIHNPEFTMESALIEYMKKNNIEDYKDNNLFMFYMATFSEADAYVRAYYRDKLITTLLGSGLELNVYGNGWENYHGTNAGNINIIKSKSADLLEGIELMARAKMIVGMIPWFKDGIQDRILNTMYNNAVCITDSTPFLRENFEDNDSIIYYDIRQMDKLPNRIQKLLSDEDKMSAIAAKGRDIADSKFSQEDFAKSLSELIEKVTE